MGTLTRLTKLWNLVRRANFFFVLARCRVKVALRHTYVISAVISAHMIAHCERVRPVTSRFFIFKIHVINLFEARPTTSHPWRMAQLHELTSSSESQLYSSSQGTLYLYPVKVAHTMKVISW